MGCPVVRGRGGEEEEGRVTKHFPHLLRNFPVAARGEKEASKRESMAPMFSEK
jgi:hypothetical protein